MCARGLARLVILVIYDLLSLGFGTYLGDALVFYTSHSRDFAGCISFHLPLLAQAVARDSNCRRQGVLMSIAL